VNLAPVCNHRGMAIDFRSCSRITTWASDDGKRGWIRIETPAGPVEFEADLGAWQEVTMRMINVLNAMRDLRGPEAKQWPIDPLDKSRLN
jgi:hypothetical protein